MYSAPVGKFIDPSIVVSHFHLRADDIVADFGAGSGHYMKPLAAAVGTRGKVYLCEIQKNLVDALGVRAHEQHLLNVYPLWCDLEAERGTTLADNLLDAGLLSNVLFQCTDKAKALGEIARVLRKGAKLFVIDWSESFGGIGPQPIDVVTESDARNLLTEAGFTCERSFPAGEHHYGIACRKN